MASRIGMRSLRTGSARLPRTSQRVTVGAVRAASGGGGYNEPTGYLFNEKPPAQGQKRERQDWENLWMYGMFGGMLFGGVLVYYKPDTTLDTWAAEEARRRLDERDGDSWKYKPSKYSGWYKPEGEGEKKLV